MRASTVDVEGGDAEQVGTPGPCAFHLELVQCLPAWVVVAVERPDRDDGEMRRHPREEGRDGGCFAAMVTHLQQIGGKIACRQRQHGGFAGCFGVAFKQCGVARIAEMEDEGVVIVGRIARLVAGCGCEDGYGDIAERHRVSSGEGADPDTEGCSLAEQLLVSGDGRIAADPEFARTEVAEDRGHAPM